MSVVLLSNPVQLFVSVDSLQRRQAPVVHTGHVS